MNCGARMNEAADVSVVFGQAEKFCSEDISPKLSVQVMNFKAIFFSLRKLGLQWQRESIHRHTGPHDQHCE